MVLSNPGNDHVSGIAGIAQEPVSMPPRLQAHSAQRRPSALRLRKHFRLASPSTRR